MRPVQQSFLARFSVQTVAQLASITDDENHLEIEVFDMCEVELNFGDRTNLRWAWNLARASTANPVGESSTGKRLTECSSTAAPSTPQKVARTDFSLPTPEKIRSPAAPSTPQKAASVDSKAWSPHQCLSGKAASVDSKGCTLISNLRTAFALAHKIMGIVCMAHAQAGVIDTKTGTRLHRYSYILGASDGVVEVSSIGSAALQVAKHIAPLLGRPICVSNLRWNSGRQSLEHHLKSVVTPLLDESIGEVLWSYSTFNDVTLPVNWSRINVFGHFYAVGESEEDVKKPGSIIQECLVASNLVELLRLRFAMAANTELHFDTGRAVHIHFANVSVCGRCLHADTLDLCDVATSATNSLCPDFAGVRELVWPRSWVHLYFILV